MFLCSALIVTLAACGGAGNQTPPAGDTTGGTNGDTTGGETTAGDNAQATAIYEANCMACHAADLSGGGAFPGLQDVGARLSKEEIANIIANGGNGMPAFSGRLSDEEINTLASWLAAKK